jgi:predicted nucleic acid-binding protein
MKICVDTCILIGILKDEDAALQNILYNAIEENQDLKIPSVVYAELLPQFKTNIKLLNLFLKEHKIKTDSLDIESTETAAARWVEYLKNRSKIKCSAYGSMLNHKEHILSDFYIGGYALTHCNAIITKDRGIYKKYFPDLKPYADCI